MSTSIKYTANFHITHDCNMRCGYCYAGEKTKTSMTQATLKQSINFVVEEVQRKKATKLVIAFLGGEPLMEKQKLFYVHDECKRRLGEEVNVVGQLSTNGLLLTESLMKDLTDRNIMVSLSLDGTPETMQKQRPTIGNSDYSKIMDRTIKNVLKHNPFTNAFCVVTPASSKNLYENITWIYDQGLRFINCTLDYSAEWTYQDFEILATEYEKLTKWYEEKCNNVEHFYLSCFDERIQTHTKKPAACANKCSIGNNQISIAPNGDIYPCMQFVKPAHEADERMQLGTVKEGFVSAKLNQFRADVIKDKPECSGCKLKERCSTWCSCINYSSTKSVSKASPVACHHEKMLIPIVDKMSAKLWREKNQLFIQKHYNPLYSFVAQAMTNYK
ncbi:radical SAM protein [uncultured Kordia sp.]|uniref:radical SAM/SPASM domain-containing protein n=1 Tax=uncultured Kordia sp. TaxID=507699 RepID=UPI00262E31C1|nr:radical SAM protein [uncultured Kordia sp.]